nr:EAL domain-containing protein [Sulfurimonas sp.]
ISRTLRLLYVEDDSRARKTTLEMLKNFFDTIVTAIDGDDGLSKFKEGSFDLIISDINMPKLNGIDMIKEIKEIDTNISVLFLSAHNESSLLNDAIRLDIDCFMLKPLNLKQFVLSLSKVCQKIQFKRDRESYKINLEKEVKQQTQELDIKLHFDELTGLHNRYSFFEDIKTIKTPIIFIADINKFKTINEIYGSEIGSLVLKQFASFLLKFAQNTSYKVYRLSGDEFLLRDKVQSIDPDRYEEDIAHFFKLLDNFKVELEDDFISLELTIGFSTSQHDAFECAKIALDFAKEHKKPYAMYSTIMDKRDKEKEALKWKNKIKSAISNNRVVPVYQAIVDKDENIVKHETLMRLKDAKNDKLITPYHFLDIAIKTGLYKALSTYIIFEALYLLESSSNTLSVNFTYTDIQSISFLNEIESFFKKSPDVARRVIFEITESESISNYEVVKKFIKRFRAYGVKIAIDDFGSGFSNFDHILEVEPEYIKIDGSLVKNIDIDKKAYVLVSAIVGFSHKLGIKVIAEYVHSRLIFEILKDLDVDEYQGFYFSEPKQELLR